MPVIFLLERDPDILFVLDYWFHRKGYLVHCFSCEEKLIETLSNIIPDVILIDIYSVTDRHNGTLCKDLKTRYLFPNKIFLLSTSFFNEKDLAHYGADSIIHKPFDLIELSDTIQAALL